LTGPTTIVRNQEQVSLLHPTPAEAVMTTELVPIPTPGPLAIGPVDVLAEFLAGRNPRTLRAYDRDLADFARSIGQPGAREAVAALLGMSHGQANLTALRYRVHLGERDLKAATIARRLAALRSVVKMARMLGVIAWTLDVASPRAVPYRDTAGPGLDGWRALLAEARRAALEGTAKAIRDLAIVRLLHDQALRRGELVALDLADVDLTERGRIRIIGKGQTDLVPITLGGKTRDALAGWIAARGTREGPLFVRLDRARGAGAPTRLTGEAVYQLVRDLGRKAGISGTTRPHGLRHQAITETLAASYTIREAMKFSRHADPKTLMVYDDNREDVAGDIAEYLARE
jgi:integrase/recombinase XerC